MNKHHSYKLEEVFGVSKRIPLTYIHRNGIDDLFTDCLKSRKNIVVHGCSKQGKTSLRNKHLETGSFITIYCQYGHSLKDLYALILKTAGFEIHSVSTDISGEKDSISAGVKVFLGLKASAESHTGKNIQRKKLELNIRDANDVINALASIQFDKYILFEDFHYLSEEVQTAFCQDIKIFEENSAISFIVIGVWLDENKLLHFNGDLALRIQNINADNWSNEDLKKAITRGEELLNIRFPENFGDTLVENAGGSIAFVQMVCYEICRDNKINKTVKGQPSKLSTSGSLYLYLGNLIDLQNSRFKSLLNALTSVGTKKENTIRLILVCLMICSIDKLRMGLTTNDIITTLKTVGDKDYKKPLIEKCLLKFKQIQAEANLRPLLLEYDESLQQLVITDKLFFLWLSTKNWNELLAEMNIEQTTRARVRMLKY